MSEGKEVDMWFAPVGFAGTPPRFDIDLNMLKRGNRIPASRWWSENAHSIKPGDAVLAVDEDRDTFLATVESCEGQRIWLQLDLGSRLPGVTFHGRDK